MWWRQACSPCRVRFDLAVWTFQEALFSRRILIFNGLVSWFCRTAVWEEHVSSPTENTVYAFTHEPHPYQLHLVADNPAWPDLDSWTEKVKEFNKRKLTYDKDVIDAFSGVTSVFNRCFSGGIIWGIPEMFFDYCIVWKPITVLRRRRVPSCSLLDGTLPSWSWAGWEGSIVPTGSAPMLNNHPQIDHNFTKIRPVVQWYKSRNPTSTCFPVKNIYHSLQHTYSNNPLEQVPTGWTREQYLDGTSYYTNDKVPSVRFRCPMPLANEDVSPFPNDQGRYLRFKSQRVWLFVGPELANIHDSWTTCPARLADDEGNWAGTIRLNMTRSDPSPRGEPCELIALSLATAVKGSDDDGQSHGSEFYTFYHVHR